MYSTTNPLRLRGGGQPKKGGGKSACTSFVLAGKEKPEQQTGGPYRTEGYRTKKEKTVLKKSGLETDLVGSTVKRQWGKASKKFYVEGCSTGLAE